MLLSFVPNSNILPMKQDIDEVALGRSFGSLDIVI
jgi:hypothetical protein